MKLQKTFRRGKILQRESLERQRIEEENRKRRIEEKGRELKLKADQLKAVESSDSPDSRNVIRVKDFVVRRSVFKCRHQKHKLQNINADIALINSKGDITHYTVSAGYCPQCHIFFIMESTYENLRRRGTPICRISDEKTYLKGNYVVNGMKLAPQSVLMQYGYSVSQEEGLTEAQRRKILAIIIDHKILTKSEVIGYLDFFILFSREDSRPSGRR